jgi:hypothetical protein
MRKPIMFRVATKAAPPKYIVGQRVTWHGYDGRIYDAIITVVDRKTVTVAWQVCTPIGNDFRTERVLLPSDRIGPAA